MPAADAAILVVDDNPAKRLAIDAILLPLGHRVVEAVSGQDALSAVEREAFAVILMDVQMPLMDGYEAARLIRLRDNVQRTPIIFVTANARDEARIPMAYSSGAVDFIFAPLEPAILRAKVSVFADLFLQSRALERANEIAMQASRTRSEFVANMSHEIRTPLNGIIGMARLLRGTALDAVQHGYVNALAVSGDTLLSVISNVLDFSKIEAGRLELDRTDFDVRSVISQVCLMLKGDADAKGVGITPEVDADVPALVNGDRARVRQILLNLLSNALKFTAQGEVRLRVSCTSSSLLHFAVSDTGIGIDAERVSELFEPFVQADQSTTRRYGGTGLGLTISRQLVQQMSGEIGAEPRTGGGSVFWFTASLPAVHDPSVHAQPWLDLGAVRVLLVSDQPGSTGLLDHLVLLGLDAQLLAEPDRTVAVLERGVRTGRPFALLVLDLSPSSMSSSELARAVRERPGSDVPKMLILTDVPIEVADLSPLGVAALVATSADRPAIEGAILELLGTRRRAAGRAVPRPGAAIDPRQTVLIAEDNEINRMLACAALAEYGLDTAIALDGREAVEMVAANDYVAVLMDCQMPRLDGFQATREIRLIETRRRVSIIAMTALAMAGDRERCLAAGMDDYLSKPIEPDALDMVIRRWIQGEEDREDLEDLAPTTGTEIDLTPVPFETGIDAMLDGPTIVRLHALSPQMRSELLDAFDEQFATCLGDIAAAVDRRDHTEVRRVAHLLKGSSAGLGATSLRLNCQRLEDIARSDGAALCDLHVDELRLTAVASSQALRGELSS